MDSAQAAPRVRRQARQARSQATETALLDAGLAHFTEHGFDGLSMSAVAERAGTSIGALYFRFGDREGFVQALLQRGFDGIRQETDALLAKAIAAHQSPTEVIGAFVDLAVRVQENSHGVFRAVLRRALDDQSAWDPVGRLANDATSRLVETLSHYPEVTAIADWEQRIRFGVFAARAAHFNRFYNPQAPMPANRAAMVAMLQALVVRNLGLPFAAHPGASARPAHEGHQSAENAPSPPSPAQAPTPPRPAKAARRRPTASAAPGASTPTDHPFPRAQP